MAPTSRIPKNTLLAVYACLREFGLTPADSVREGSHIHNGLVTPQTIRSYVADAGGDKAVCDWWQNLADELQQIFAEADLQPVHAGSAVPGPVAGVGSPAENPQARIDRQSRERELGQEIRLLNKTIDDQRKSLLSQQELIETIAGWIPQIPTVTPPQLIYKPGREEAITGGLWSDFHCNRTVSYLQTEGFGEYNEEIFCSRFWKMLQKTVAITEIQRQEHNIRRLAVFQLGDAMNDEFRDENKRANIAPNLVATIKFASPITQGFRFLLQHFEVIEVFWHSGNEGRNTVKMPAKFRTDNWDYLLGMLLQIILAEEIRHGRIVFHLPQSWSSIAEVMGWKFLLSHGNDVKGSVWGIPEYGLRRWEDRQHKMRRPSRKHPDRKDYDKWFHGHFHTAYITGDRVGNGALTGTDEYAYNLSLADDPSQWLTFITEQHCDTCWYKLDLSAIKGHPFEVMEDQAIIDQLHNFDKKLTAGL